MPRENKDTEKKSQGKTIELSSPPCLMGEVDPGYMGLNNIPENNQMQKKEDN